MSLLLFRPAVGVHFDVYAGGHVSRSGELSERSPAVQELGKLLRDCSGKWRTSLITYATGIAFKTRHAVGRRVISMTISRLY
jgi:hypothetical protein